MPPRNLDEASVALDSFDAGARELPDAGISTRELVIVLGLTLLACLLRAWAFERVGFGYIDEGVYGMSALGMTDPSQPHRIFPMQARYSPPVYFSLVALSFLLSGGPSDHAAIAVNVVLGTLLVPIAWLLGRAWFGSLAGVLAAGLVAFSEFHILLSRSGMTDIAFAVAFSLAIWALGRAMEQGGLGRAMVAGLAIGLAWNTKYHGWFVLAIGGGAWMAWVLLGKPTREARVLALRAWIVASLIATVCFIPWAVFIHTRPESTSGWSKYFSQWLSVRWMHNLSVHVGMQYLLDGPWSRAAPLAAMAGVVLYGGVAARSARRVAGVAAVLIVGALSLGGAAVALALALASIPELLRRRTRLTTWLALGWGALWIGAAPFYFPFFRLLLPFTIVVYLAAGLAVARWVGGGGTTEKRHRAVPATLCLTAAAAVFLVSLQRPRFSDPWRDATGMRRAVAAMTQVLPTDAEVDVVIETPAMFYLQLNGRRGSRHLAGWSAFDTTRRVLYVVTGMYAPLSPEIGAQLAEHRWVADSLGRFPYTPNDLRVLEDLTPAIAAEFRARPGRTIHLDAYRFRPAATSP